VAFFIGFRMVASSLRATDFSGPAGISEIAKATSARSFIAEVAPVIFSLTVDGLTGADSGAACSMAGRGLLMVLLAILSIIQAMAAIGRAVFSTSF